MEFKFDLTPFSWSPSSGDAQEAFADALCRMHRTEQQNVVRFLAKALKCYGLDCLEGNVYDARNEAAVQWCAHLEDPCLPYV